MIKTDNSVGEPLIPNTVLSRWLIAGIGLALTLGAGWAARSIAQTNTGVTQILTHIDNLQQWQTDLDNEVDSINQRIDTVNTRVDELEHTLLEALIKRKSSD